MQWLKLRSVGNLAYVLLVGVLIVVGALRISSTYTVFSQTWDEPFHIASGMEWLEEGRYTYELFHPPLARVMGALGPYLNGIRGVETIPGNPGAKGSTLLHSSDSYEYTLTLARIGILPFFVLASLVVVFWAQSCSGRIASLIALALFTTLPTILAHGGLATLDMACAALVTAALLILTLWLSRPTFPYSVGLGITTGLAALSKMSALGFLIISGCLIAAAYALNCYKENSAGRNQSTPNIREILTASAVAVLICTLTIWAGYRFSVGSLAETADAESVAYAYQAVDSLVGPNGLLHDIAISLLEFPILAPEFFVGFFRALYRASNGHLTFFLGEIRILGWWYFYPVILMVKTPLPTIALSMVGVFFIFRSIFIGNKNWFPPLAPFLVFVAIMGIGMLSSVNNGLRQLLGVYGPLTVMAGYGAAKLLSLGHRVSRGLGTVFVLALVLWQSIVSFRAHPDYLTYFNELAGPHPERIIVDSDLDWGQDLKRLAASLQDYKVEELKLQYTIYNIPLDTFGFPPTQLLKPYTRETGWIAVSISRLTTGSQEPPYDQYAWLKEYEPVKIIGKTIWLYYIDPNAISTKQN